MSLQRLIKGLQQQQNNLNIFTTSRLVQNYLKTNNGDWKKYVNHKEINHLLRKGEKFDDIIKNNDGPSALMKFDGYDKVFIKTPSKLDCDIAIISWHGGSETPIHGHPENGCWVGVLDGELKVEEYRSNGSVVKKTLLSGSDDYINDVIGKHKIIHDKPATSIHIYSPKIYHFDSFWWLCLLLYHLIK